MAQSNIRPSKFEVWDRNHTLVNYNVTEHEIEREGKTEIEYEYDQVIVETPVTYANLVEALIRTQYTISGELAIQRQREEKVEEFEAYNTFCEDQKVLAKQLLDE